MSWVAADDPLWFVANVILTYALGWTALYAFTRVDSREYLLRLILANGTIAVLILVLELPAVLGLLDYRALFRVSTLVPWKNPEYEVDDELVHRRPAHFTASGETYGDITYLLDVPNANPYPFDVHLDHNGFRNATDLERADVVLMGDSFIEAGLVSDESHVGTLLSRELQQTVASLGNVGYGPRHQLVMLRRYALPLEPRTVVWLFFEGNDLANIVTYDSLVAVTGREAGAAPWQDRSFSRNALVQVMRLAGNPRPSAMRRSGVVNADDGTTERAFFLYGIPPMTAQRQQLIDEFARIIGEANVLGEQAGVHLLVAFVPIKFRVYADMLTDRGEVSAQWSPDDLPARIEAIVREVSPQIGFLDLTIALRGAARAGAFPYFPDDSHWDADGHEAAARALAEALKEPQSAPTRQVP